MAKRRRMTAARRRQIHMAQMMSAKKRKVRSKDMVGHWVAKGVRKVASMATMGASSAIIEFADNVKASNKRKQAERLKRHRRKKR